MGADDLGWAARYLVGLDCGFAVRQPPQMRESLARLGRELVAASAPDPEFTTSADGSSSANARKGGREG
jgi:hypothetical protein